MKLFDFDHDGNTDFYEEMMGLHIISSSLSEAEDTDDLELCDETGDFDCEDDDGEEYDDEEYEEDCDDEEYEDFDDLEGDYDDISDLF